MVKLIKTYLHSEHYVLGGLAALLKGAGPAFDKQKWINFQKTNSGCVKGVKLEKEVLMVTNSVQKNGHLADIFK